MNPGIVIPGVIFGLWLLSAMEDAITSPKGAQRGPGGSGGGGRGGGGPHGPGRGPGDGSYPQGPSTPQGGPGAGYELDFEAEWVRQGGRRPSPPAAHPGAPGVPAVRQPVHPSGGGGAAQPPPSPEALEVLQDTLAQDQQQLDQQVQTINEQIWEWLRKYAAKIPFSLEMMQVYYCMMDPKTNFNTKAMCAAALAYVVLPDLVPEQIFGPLGLLDDAAILGYVAMSVAGEIMPEHRRLAHEALGIDDPFTPEDESDARARRQQTRDRLGAPGGSTRRAEPLAGDYEVIDVDVSDGRTTSPQLPGPVYDVDDSSYLDRFKRD